MEPPPPPPTTQDSSAASEPRSIANFVIRPDYMTRAELDAEIEARLSAGPCMSRRTSRAASSRAPEHRELPCAALPPADANPPIPLNNIFPTTLLKALVANQLSKHEEAKKCAAVPVAPFPSLPKREQICSLIDLHEREITTLKSQIALLERQRRAPVQTVLPATGIDPRVNVQNAKGFLVPHNDISAICSVNSAKVRRATAMFTLDSVAAAYNHLSDLREVRKTLSDHEEFVEPMLKAISYRRKIAKIKALNLANEYAERMALNASLNAQLERYSNETRERMPSWPPEFHMLVYKIPNVKGCAPDQCMYLDDLERESYMFYDMNKLIEDPVKHHQEYKKRVGWTELEKQIFLEKYAQHPKDFKKIASSLPTKSIKDVIEFYGVNRIKLNLKAIEHNAKKRGRKKSADAETKHEAN